mgnify:CR=1 FL=1
MQTKEYAITLARLKKDILEQHMWTENAILAQKEGCLDVSESLHAIDHLNKRIRHGVVMLDMYASTSSYQLGADPIDLDELK